MQQLEVILILLSLATGVLSNDGVMTDLRVIARIEQRYAQTTVSSTMKNPNPEPRELKFKMTLPKSAFISSLIMEIEGQNYTSTVKEKSAARKTYDTAKKRGKTTGLVEQRDDAQQKFEVSANVAALGKVTFYLRYEELLRRFKGKYLYEVDVKPGHVVPVVAIDVTIMENEAIKDLNITETPGKGSGIEDVSQNRPSPGEVQLSYLHEDAGGPTSQGLDGSFSLTYDVHMHPDGGEVQVVGNYFVHHFSPEGLPRMPVHTIFVLDISYSMSDGKLEQLKEAMKTILEDLKREDTFELIAFASVVEHLGSFSGKKKDLTRALKKVKRLQVTGSTNLYDAYMESVRSIMAFNQTKVARQILFLTDGVATAGQTDKKIIRRTVRETNNENHPIFGLAFGNDADFQLLNEISSDNRAYARKIAFGAYTQDQLKGFYDEISTPLMAEVDIDYDHYEVESNSIVKQGTSNFYSGGEVVSAGQIVDGVTEVRPVVRGVGKEGPLQFQVQRLDSRPAESSSEKENFVARLWAYLMVQELLDKAKVAEDAGQIERLKSKALQIALRFNFVTKLTSLVVVRPEDESAADEASEGTLDRQKRKRLSQAQPSSGSGWSRASTPLNYAQPSSGSGRSRASRPQNYVDNDPHFVVSSPGMALPFCFDLHAQHGAVLSLIRDPDSGIVVNGQVSSAMGRPELTYFTRLYLAFGDFKLILTPDILQAECPQRSEVQSMWPFYNKHGKKMKSRNSKHQNPRHRRNVNKENTRTKRSATDCDQFTTWKSAAGKRIGDVTLTLPKRRRLHITLRDGEVHFVIVRSKNKYNQWFLGFYVKDERIFSSNTTGIIGEFSAKSVTMTSKPADASNDNFSANSNNTMDVSVQRWNHRKVYEMSQVSGYLGHRRSLLEKILVRCIHVRNSGRGLLDGTPDDYIVSCVTC